MDDSEEHEQTDRRPSRSERRRSRRHARAEAHQRRKYRRMVPNLLISALLFVLIVLIVSERPVPIPAILRQQIEDQVNTRLAGDSVRVGRAAVSLGSDGGAQVRLGNVRIGDPGGGAVAFLNSMRASLVPSALLRGKIRADTLHVDGAQITLRRGGDGRLSVVADGAETARTMALGDLLGSLEHVLSRETFSAIHTVSATGIVLTVEDARSGRIWQATNARMTLRRKSDGLTLSLASDVFNGTDAVAEVQLSFDFTSETRNTSLGIRVVNMPAADIAQQSPILAWLGVLDAPISGAVRVEYDGTEGLRSLAGTLDIAAGALSPVEGLEPQPFDQARAYFRFDPRRQRLAFSEVSVSAERFFLRGTGQTFLTDPEDGWPTAFVGQFRLDDVQLADTGLLEGAVELSGVTADLRLRLDPFTVELGQVTLPNDGYPVKAKGSIEARQTGWSVAIDGQTEQIAPETVMAFWPLAESKGTRTWLSRNVHDGNLTDATFVLRKTSGQRSRLGLTFDFDGGQVRFLPEMPPIVDGKGRGSLIHDTFTLVLEEGVLPANDGGAVDGAGSVMVVPDIHEKPTRGFFDIRASGDIQDVFRIAANRPLRLLERVGRGHDFATGAADVSARLELPLVKSPDLEDVFYDVSARLRDARSDTLVEGRTLASKDLNVTIGQEEVAISGPMTLDGVDLNARWSQALGRDAPKGSAASGRIRISRAALDAFSIPLTQDLVSGEGWGDFSLDLRPDAPPELSLRSSLEGLGLSIEGLGWSKSAATPAQLTLNATLGDSPEVQRLSLEAPGLTLDGRVGAAPGSGRLGDITFDTLRVGNWLNASARMSAGGQGIALTGGSLDLRNLPSSGRGSDGQSSRITVNLDMVTVSDGLRLSPVQGVLNSTQLGVSGDFQGRLNGGAVVVAGLAPTGQGTAIRIQSNDAAGVVRDARLTPNARGGTLDIVLTPRAGSVPGTYDGQFLIENIAIKDAPVMAALLDAMSVVGLMDRLGGSGIGFDTVDGRFLLSPGRLVFREVAASGASLGISANGVYDLGSGRMDIEGVVSPFYFLNAVGQLVSRRGEGLFGVNYRVTGLARDPRISVNPLSILTPGFFREIFRRPPPEE